MGATSTLSRRTSEFAGVALFGASLIWLIALATYEPTDPVWFFTVGRHERTGQLRRPGRGIRGRGVVPVARLHLVPRPGDPRRAGLELLLVPDRGCRLHQGGRRDAVCRLPRGPVRPRAWQRRDRRADVPRRRLRGRVDRRRLHRLPQSPRLDHRHRHPARARRDPHDAVLVRPVVHGRVRGRRGRGRARVDAPGARGARTAARTRSGAR